VLTPAASPGYTLVALEQSTWTYLVDRRGREVHRWASAAPPGQSTELLPSGLLLRAEELHVDGAFPGGKGRGGVVEELTWSGRSAWRFQYASPEHQLHRDVEDLPNGNVLMIAREHKSVAEAVAAGRDPTLLSGGALWPDHVIEVDPHTDRIVWRWHVWDHLVQDFDPGKANYGDPSDHPGRIDVNYTKGGHGGADWNHTNSVAYDAERDEIVLSVRQFSEIRVIDHSTTTEEARGPAGDLKFRWGNPATHDKGSDADETLFFQHDARWTTDATGAPAFTVFDHGAPKVRQYSTVDLVVPTLVDGDYVLDAQGRFAAEERRLYPVGSDGEFFAPQHLGCGAPHQRRPARHRCHRGPGLRGDTGREDGVGVRQPVLHR
jgi:hypothetical protein